MFKDLQQLIQERYNKLATAGTPIFIKDVDKDKIWEIYLNTFAPDDRQSHNCNNCRIFLRQFSGLTFFVNHKPVGIWDIDTNLIDLQYRPAINAIRYYVGALPVTNAFLHFSKKLGVPSNRDGIKNVMWYHFGLETQIRPTNELQIPSLLSAIRSGKEVLKRALDELTTYACNTVLELTEQGSLYRGAEFIPLVKEFLKLKNQYDLLNADQKDGYAWVQSMESGTVKGIRNTAIGTLLINLSAEMDLDTAVRKYEDVVAPANYKRPTALVTPKMIESAKTTINELGFIDSLERRFAVPTDIDINNVLFVDRSSTITDVFGDMTKDAVVNIKKLSKVEEITISDFLTNVVPTAKTIELLIENSHLNNFVSILTATNPGTPSMFKWNNPFSLAYSGGVADAMKERVKQAGGNVNGVLRFSIQWNDEDTPGIPDFDAHAFEPTGQHIYFGNYRGLNGVSKSPNSGFLDVDMTGSSHEPKVRVENIVWTDLSQMRDGAYRLSINNFNGRTNKGFKAQVEFNGEIHDFIHTRPVQGTLQIAVVTLSKGVFTIKPELDMTSDVTSTTKWGVKTNVYTKVKTIMLSPNYWQEPSMGNKHYMFMLDGAISDEETRPFLNEFLKEELNIHRKVFEIMGGRLLIKPTPLQLSGVGFSETQSNQLIARVTGTFQRVLKIKF